LHQTPGRRKLSAFACIITNFFPLFYQLFVVVLVLIKERNKLFVALVRIQQMIKMPPAVRMVELISTVAGIATIFIATGITIRTITGIGGCVLVHSFALLMAYKQKLLKNVTREIIRGIFRSFGKVMFLPFVYYELFLFSSVSVVSVNYINQLLIDIIPGQ
jgi:hypothetical protein